MSDPQAPKETDDAKSTDNERVNLGKIMRLLMERNPIGQETVERVLDILIRMLSRREILERILNSEFIRHVKDMQSEITEVFGLASQADMHDLKERLDETNQRLAKLQKTLDDIVVEVDTA